MQRSLPAGAGLGYLMHAGADSSSGPSANGYLQAQGEHGRVEVDYLGAGPDRVATALVAGGVVAMGGGVFFTRPLHEGYALLQVPGVEGVEASLEHEAVGRTNRDGNVLVPNLVPYYGHQLGITATDVPLRYQVEATTRLAAAPFRGGTLVRFPIRRLRVARGTVTLEQGGKATPAAFGQLTVTSGEERFVSPLGADGAFYFENLPPGR